MFEKIIEDDTDIDRQGALLRPPVGIVTDDLLPLRDPLGLAGRGRRGDADARPARPAQRVRPDHGPRAGEVLPHRRAVRRRARGGRDRRRAGVLRRHGPLARRQRVRARRVAGADAGGVPGALRRAAVPRRRARHRRPRDAGDPRPAQAGDRRDQRRRGRHRRHDDAGAWTSGWPRPRRGSASSSGGSGSRPEAASTWFLPRIVGLQQALEWIYAADILTAEAALAGRLVRSVHQPEELLPAAQELARSFVRGRSPVALGLAKQLLYRHAGSAEPLEAHLSDSLGGLLDLDVGRQGGRRGVPREAAGGRSPARPPSCPGSTRPLRSPMSTRMSATRAPAWCTEG